MNDDQPTKHTPKLVYITIIILLVLSLAALGDWYWYKTRQLDKQVAEATSKIASVEADKAKLEADKKAAEDAASANKDFFVIKEWGVKFKPDKLTDLTYAIRDNKFVYFSTSSIMTSDINTRKSDANTDCSPIGTSMAGMSRGMKTDVMEPGTATYDKVPGAVKVGDYYYVVSHPQSTCSDDKTTQGMVSAQYKQLAEAIKTLQASK